MPFIGSVLSKVKKFHTEQISGSDTINILLLMLDKDYRRQVWKLVCQNVFYNHKLRPALKELSIEYGYKLEELNDMVWQQSELFDNIA